MKYFFLLSLLCIDLLGEIIPTFYGDIRVEEPVLIELIHSPAMQRLKGIHQYGVSYYTTHPEEYTRFAHSLGVFTVLKMKGASLEEQIAGLLHDISHTVFSHVGDWVFKVQHKDSDYQSSIHASYLRHSGLETILNHHGYTVEQVLPQNIGFTLLEQPLPNLNADRIDYNIQGAYFQHFLSEQEALELFDDIYFDEGKWIITKKHLAEKLTRFSLFMTQDCWSSIINHIESVFLADALLRGIEIGLLTWDDFHFGIDQDIWDRLHASSDELIKERMQRLTHTQDYIRCVSPELASTFIRFKSRGIDPWIQQEGKIERLSSLDEEIAEALKQLKARAAEGWPVIIIDDPAS